MYYITDIHTLFFFTLHLCPTTPATDEQNRFVSPWAFPGGLTNTLSFWYKCSLNIRKWWVFKNVHSTVTKLYNCTMGIWLLHVPNPSWKTLLGGKTSPLKWCGDFTERECPFPTKVGRPVRLVELVWDRTEWHSGKDHSDISVCKVESRHVL